MNKESWYTAKSSDMDVIRILETDDWVVEYDKNRGIYRVSYFEDFHFKDEVWFDAHKEKSAAQMLDKSSVLLRRTKMKGFIEVTGIQDKNKIKLLVNVSRIIAVAEFGERVRLMCVGDTTPTLVEESYEEIKAKIAEAVGDSTHIVEDKTHDNNIVKHTAKWIISSDGYYPYCSNCQSEPKSKEMTDYCPICGACMKEGIKE